MTTVIGAGVSLDGVGLESGQTYSLRAGILFTDEGAPVTTDTTANATAKLGADGDPIIGQLFRVENRVAEGIVVGTVITEGGMRFPIKPADALAVGDVAVCAGSSQIRKLIGSDNVDSIKPLWTNRVVEVDATTTPHTAVLWFA